MPQGEVKVGGIAAVVEDGAGLFDFLVHGMGVIGVIEEEGIWFFEVAEIFVEILNRNEVPGWELLFEGVLPGWMATDEKAWVGHQVVGHRLGIGLIFFLFGGESCLDGMVFLLKVF